MQVLSTSNDSLELKFDAIESLNKNINEWRNTHIHMQKKDAIISEIQNLDPPIILDDEPTIDNKTERIIVKETLNDEKHPTDVDDNNRDVIDVPLGMIAEKVEPDIDFLVVRTFKNYFKQMFDLITNLHLIML